MEYTTSDNFYSFVLGLMAVFIFYQFFNPPVVVIDINNKK